MDSDIFARDLLFGGQKAMQRAERVSPDLDALVVALRAARLRLDQLPGWDVLRKTLPWLVDHIAIAPEAIHAQVMDVPGVLNCHDIASRGVLGQQVFIDMHMVVEADDLTTAHRITEHVEQRLDHSFGPVRCTIHLEPKDYVEEGITYSGTHG